MNVRMSSNHYVIVKLKTVKEVDELIETIERAQSEGVHNDTNQKLLEGLRKVKA